MNLVEWRPQLFVILGDRVPPTLIVRLENPGVPRRGFLSCGSARQTLAQQRPIASTPKTLHRNNRAVPCLGKPPNCKVRSVPLRGARIIQDLGRNDFVKVNCAARHHIVLLAPEALLRIALAPVSKALDLKESFRCRLVRTDGVGRWCQPTFGTGPFPPLRTGPPIKSSDVAPRLGRSSLSR